MYINQQAIPSGGNIPTLQDILDLDFKLNIVRCSDGDFVFKNLQSYKIHNLQLTETDEKHTRVTFHTFESIPYGFKMAEKYFFMEERVGFECSSTINTSLIINHYDTMENYIACQKIETL